MKMKLHSKITLSRHCCIGCLVGLVCPGRMRLRLGPPNCASCHGKDGKGDTMMGRKLSIKDLTDPKVQSSFTDADATKAIKEGVTDKDGTEKMKAFGTS